MSQTRQQPTGAHRMSGFGMRRLVNPAVRVVLGSPAHRVVSGGLVGVAYAGRLTGRTCRLVTGYAQAGDGTVLVLVGNPSRKAWWRNFRQPLDAELLLRGQSRAATGVVLPQGSHQWGDGAEVYAAQRPRAASALSGAELVAFTLR